MNVHYFQILFSFFHLPNWNCSNEYERLLFLNAVKLNLISKWINVYFVQNKTDRKRSRVIYLLCRTTSFSFIYILCLMFLLYYTYLFIYLFIYSVFYWIYCLFFLFWKYFENIYERCHKLKLNSEKKTRMGLRCVMYQHRTCAYQCVRTWIYENSGFVLLWNAKGWVAQDIVSTSIA